MEQVGEAKDKILDVASNHPVVLLIVIGVLFIIIVAMYFGLLSGTKEHTKNKTKSVPADGDTDIDKLIEEIHSKQGTA